MQPFETTFACLGDIILGSFRDEGYGDYRYVAEIFNYPIKHAAFMSEKEVQNFFRLIVPYECRSLVRFDLVVE